MQAFVQQVVALSCHHASMSAYGFSTRSICTGSSGPSFPVHRVQDAADPVHGTARTQTFADQRSSVLLHRISIDVPPQGIASILCVDLLRLHYTFRHLRDSVLMWLCGVRRTILPTDSVSVSSNVSFKHCQAMPRVLMLVSHWPIRVRMHRPALQGSRTWLSR
jgi:hypothetical protein